MLSGMNERHNMDTENTGELHAPVVPVVIQMHVFHPSANPSLMSCNSSDLFIFPCAFNFEKPNIYF